MENQKQDKRAGASVISGVIKKVIFRNEENGFTILSIFYAGKFITASGVTFAVPVQDCKVRLEGNFAHHKKYGYQFNFSSCEISLPDGRSAIIDYLSSSIFKGIGKVIAGDIYEKFKEKTLHVIDNEPERLIEVSGIGNVKLTKVIDGLKKTHGLRQAIMFFKPYRFSDYQIKAIYDRFKEKSVSVAKENPYRFTEIKGIGFKRADAMAEKLGVEKNNPDRVKEAVRYIVNETCESSGGCFVYFRDIKEGIEEIAEKIEDSVLSAYIVELAEEKKLITETSGETEIGAKDPLWIKNARIYLPVFYFSEIGLANELKRIAAHGKPTSEDRFKTEDLRKFLESGGAGPVRLTDEQEDAVLNALNRKISVISGGPGTGKSTVIKTIVGMCSGKKIALTSLSGKAAQRLADIVTGGSANIDSGSGFLELPDTSISTIHRLLKAQFDGRTGETSFFYNEKNKLPYGVVVIDEMSMVDVVVFHKLLKAVRDDATIIMVGDVNQIPSVSPGDILRDIINAEERGRAVFPSTFLTRVFRQDEGGLINVNAHNLLNNKKFITASENKGKKEFSIRYKKEYDAPETGKIELLKDFKEFINKLAKKRKESDINAGGSEISATAFDDIQVLTPMKKGELGYYNINRILQEAFNPSPIKESAGAAIFICNGIEFRLRDKVIQKKNNYDLDVFNGDTGYISAIDHIEKTVSVEFGRPVKNSANESGGGIAGISKNSGKTAVYDFLDVHENIMPAYALSIHKAQGSEFDNVIILFHQSHYMMLKKNLLYTAITRGKKNVVIFGTFKAFGIAANSKEDTRNSSLKERIAAAFRE